MIKTYNFVEKQAGIRLIEFNVRESGKRFLAKRVRLRNNIFSRLRLRFFRQKAESNNLVKFRLETCLLNEFMCCCIFRNKSILSLGIKH